MCDGLWSSPVSPLSRDDLAPRTAYRPIRHREPRSPVLRFPKQNRSPSNCPRHFPPLSSQQRMINAGVTGVHAAYRRHEPATLCASSHGSGRSSYIHRCGRGGRVGGAVAEHGHQPGRAAQLHRPSLTQPYLPHPACEQGALQGATQSAGGQP